MCRSSDKHNTATESSIQQLNLKISKESSEQIRTLKTHIIIVNHFHNNYTWIWLGAILFLHLLVLVLDRSVSFFFFLISHPFCVEKEIDTVQNSFVKRKWSASLLTVCVEEKMVKRLYKRLWSFNNLTKDYILIRNERASQEWREETRNVYKLQLSKRNSESQLQATRPKKHSSYIFL